MADLFRYIEHAFAVPAPTDSIDATNNSQFQKQLNDIVTAGEEADLGASDTGAPALPPPEVSEQVRTLSRQFLTTAFTSPTADPATLGKPLDGLDAGIGKLATVTPATVKNLIKDTFGSLPDQLVTQQGFKNDRELLQNAVVAVKLVTGFDRIDAARVVRQLRAAAFVVHMATNPTALDRTGARRLFDRPLRVPPRLLSAVTPPPPAGLTSRTMTDHRAGQKERDHLDQLRQERDWLRTAYDRLLAARPDELHLTAPGQPSSGTAVEQAADEAERPDLGVAVEAAAPAEPALLLLTDAAQARFSREEAAAMARLGVRLEETAVPVALDRIEQRLTALGRRLLPQEVPTSARVFRVGAHLFAETTDVMPPSEEAPVEDAPAREPDFSKAVTRPVGFGDLLVVRQEVTGYRAGEISHIENVMEHELLRRRTRRTEESEITETEETSTSRTEERDHQSTTRDELAGEIQREAGQQTTAASERMTSSDYGRLVENNKTNYAQTVVAKSVESRTQQARTERVRRERRSFTEHVGHTIENQGANKLRGVYQWVDKVYSMRLLNYGKRLMYDVVVPEPAAVLTQALKDAAQPEQFQLVKPLPPDLAPEGITASTYTWYANRYGVTGSVTPPPAVFARTVSRTQVIEGTKKVSAYGSDFDLPHMTAFTLTVPEGYKAVSGYVHTVNDDHVTDASPGRTLEVFVGENVYERINESARPVLNASFQMAGETGEVPVSARTFPKVVGMAYAVALVCQRTDEAYSQWQLKTHATIMSGYQRQLAEYEDKLARYVAAARAQLAAAGGLAHDPSVTLQELKRAFVFLLLGEHPTTWLPTPTPAPAPPNPALPDPGVVRDWGAVVAFFERAFEWENLMYTCYPYYWGRPQRWQELLLAQDADPRFEAFLKAGAARVVVPVRPGFEAALAHYQETGDVWMGEEIPDMYGDHYLSVIAEIKAANRAPGQEVCVERWEVTVPTTLVLLKDDDTLPSWPATPCGPAI
ncbi:hypothetical protein ABTY20_09710 [Streptomyces sp. NPDC126497]|uniref:hypothetical protein n=1 Tax=Streptomyces sp. NPDC126497 TaxID=3155313 RepID=UPI0033217CB3